MNIAFSDTVVVGGLFSVTVIASKWWESLFVGVLRKSCKSRVSFTAVVNTNTVQDNLRRSFHSGKDLYAPNRLTLIPIKGILFR